MKYYKKSEFYILLFLISSSLILILFYLNLSYIGFKSSIYFTMSFFILILDFIFLIFYYYVRYRTLDYYMKIIESFNKIKNMDSFVISEIFPVRDEYGELGKYLNNYLRVLKKFDDLKKERIFLEKNKVKFFINLLDYPIIILNKEGYIVEINDKFYKDFNFDSDTIFNGMKIFSFFSNSFEKKFNEFKDDSIEKLTLLEESNIYLLNNQIYNKVDNGMSIKKKYLVEIEFTKIASSFIILGEENLERTFEIITKIKKLKEEREE